MKGKGFCKIDVSSDKNNKTVTFGDYTISSPRYLEWKDFFRHRSFEMIDENPSGYGAKRFTEKFGISPTTLKKIVNAHVREMWFKDLEDIAGLNIIKKSCMKPFTPWGNKKHYLLFQKVNKYHSKLDVLKQLANDGILNVAPLLIEMNIDVPTFRKKFGKGVWKTVIKNSYRHNQLLADAVFTVGRRTDEVGLLGNTKIILKLRSFTVEQLIDSNLRNVRIEDITEIQKTLEKERKLTKTFTSFSNLFSDTRRMAAQLGETFNPRWSTRTMKERHDKYTDLILKEKYSDKLFDWLEGEENKFVVNKDGVVATLLKSPLDYHSEGTKMRHCIASYSSRAARGEYIAYHISSDKEETTCAFYVENGQFKSFNQHHGHCNSKVKDERHIDMRNHLMYTVWNKEKIPFYVGEEDL